MKYILARRLCQFAPNLVGYKTEAINENENIAERTKIERGSQKIREKNGRKK